MKCTVVSYSLSHDPASLTEWQNRLVEELQDFIQKGSEIILYPELFLMGLSKYFEGNDIQNVARYTSEKLLPELHKLLKDKNIFLVLGSGPREVNGNFFNSCPVYFENKWHFQDKLFLTPWETDFVSGHDLSIFTFKGLRTAVVVCFDSEQPDLAMKLKESEIHLLLVPSATTNENGSHRVNRCSSARSVELGAAVLTAPLVGESACELVDHNEGRQGFFLPAQESVKVPQETFSEYSVSKKVICDYELDIEMLKKLKEKDSETKPYHKSFHSGFRVTNR